MRVLLCFIALIFQVLGAFRTLKVRVTFVRVFRTPSVITAHTGSRGYLGFCFDRQVTALEDLLAVAAAPSGASVDAEVLCLIEMFIVMMDIKFIRVIIS